ncbi:MarR family transcriptional regulator [Sulfitobacter mediterraneus]|jgi:DNA-binding MarR family transcriptional regulator|uniref:MarR family winged helix-turn-helix transcriptional regulator n=1 Tax=Sulfitobacter mediterraneus TaxID=83219 RepID=UPI00193ACBB4|nr:MarR family transcriptional regulator [Sulfitobacter mediterraneus]MBM1634999.1 MarR family transcriptional regulator [Sulfitobacter mediterraneus]MBM1642868.1 MarR family transcriptional regulator [Sulfitobacter mediterraneus]MBM1646897.1 MarR family transcriptional regulator [Sulfitobacter mediterraneus]MBM1650930.1 MarR family transcriptional regulator [Sulfitobacter mediterraneus]MBM1655007.1 MarR family transcriptional regulator [Sulfitobacter mediterraneus]
MTDMKDADVASPRLGEMGLENFAPYLMNRIIGRYNAAINSEMAALGLTTPQMRSLAVLSVVDGVLIRELAVYAVVQQSTLSRALDQLAQNGLIRRETDENDSRATRVFLTNTGREAYERLWPHMAAAYEAMFVGIDEDEKRAFVGTLQKILRNIRKHDF